MQAPRRGGALAILMILILALLVAAVGMGQDGGRSGQESGEQALEDGRAVFTDAGRLWEGALSLTGSWRGSRSGPSRPGSPQWCP